jgi:hypothetical protein
MEEVQLELSPNQLEEPDRAAEWEPDRRQKAWSSSGTLVLIGLRMSVSTEAVPLSSTSSATSPFQSVGISGLEEWAASSSLDKTTSATCSGYAPLNS